MSGCGWVVRQLLRAFVGAVVLVLVLAGMPWLLLVLTRRVMADPPDVAALVDEPLSGALLVLLTVAGAWAVWGWLLVGGVLEAVDRVRQPARRRLRTPAPLYASVTAVLGTVTLLLDGFAVRATADAGPATGGPVATSTHTDGGRDVPAPAPAPGRGIDLGDGGWLPLPAAAAGAVAAWIWGQRRRHYDPQPPHGAYRSDPDLAELAELAELVAPGEMDGRVTIGVAGGRWLDLADLPAGGVHLTGAGTPAALRGLLVTVLSAAGADGPAVVTTTRDLRWLLGVDLTGVPGLHVVDDPDTVTLVAATLAAAGHRTLIIRGRTSHPVGSSGSLRAGLTVVTAGADPSLPSWQVHADGTVPAARARLAVLDAPAAAVILAGRQRATPNPPAPPPVAAADTEAADTEAADTEAAESADAAPAPAAATAPRQVRRLQLTMLGTVKIAAADVDGTATPVTVRRTASLHLLLLLAVHRTGHTGDDLTTVLWPDPPARSGTRRSGTRQFATNLSELRRSLQQATGVDVIHRIPGVAGGSRYRLDPDHVEVDLWRFHDLLDAAHSAGNATARRALLRQAADLHRGELADGLTGAWLDPAREATARHCIDVLTYLADAEPDHEAALALLHRAARLAPDNETVARAVLRRHATAGDVDGVHRAYRTLHERRAAVGGTPQPATTRLYDELTGVDLAQPAAAGASAPERTPR